MAWLAWHSWVPKLNVDVAMVFEAIYPEKVIVDYTDGPSKVS